MIDDLFGRFDGAFADSTLKAYRADFGHYSDWCVANNLGPLETQGNDFVRFIEHMALTLSSATIRRHVASISTVLRLSERHDVTKSASVVLSLKRMHRQKGRAQKQAVPLTSEVLEKLLSVCDGSSRGLRDRLMLRLGYETMRRRAELCALRFEDLEVLPNGKAALRLRFSKTDQYGVGKLLPVSNELLADIRRWGERAGMSSYLLRRVYRKDVIGNDLDPASINRRLRDLQVLARLELGGKLSGHSFRVGAALDFLEQGEPLEKIMLRGGWQAESTVIRYLRAWQAVS
jgi:integrase